ncbi:hypothetical protein [Palleronia sp.]|uniref:hypothetical protein n=1 Tax=Palleronia sp. TaxID=1940284 RepID=UPI0035C8014F
MRFFVVLATLGTLAACNTANTDPVGVGVAPDTTLGDQIASPTEGFETETGVE